MAFSKLQIAALHKELDTVLKAFAEKHNLVAGQSKIRYSSNDFKAELTFGDKTANPDAIDPRYLRDLRANGLFAGLDSSMIGTMLELPGKSGRIHYKFVGMRASKAVCLCTDDENKPYLWDAEFIAKQIKLQAPKA